MEQTWAEAVLIVEVPHPSVLPYVLEFAGAHRKVVVEFLDDWRDPGLGSDWFKWEAMEHMITNASLVSCTARVLCDSIRGLSDRIMYLPNAANEAEFHPWQMAPASRLVRPAEMSDASKRTALYFGSLYGSWFRWDYVFAAARRCREVDIIIIGDPSDNQRKAVAEHPNVHLVGLRQHSELAPYLHAATVAILPFSPGELLETISPVKIFEYGFAGKATVATFSHELEGYPFLSQANSCSDFARQVCDHDSPASVFDTVDFMVRHSWGARLEALLALPPVASDVVVVVLPVGGVRGTLRLMSSLALHLPQAATNPQVKVFDGTGVMDGWTAESEAEAGDIAGADGVDGLSSGRGAAVRVEIVRVQPPAGRQSPCVAARAQALAYIQLLPAATLVAVVHHSAVVTSAGWLRLADKRLGDTSTSVLVHSFEAGMSHAQVDDWQPGAVCGQAQLCVGKAGAFKPSIRGSAQVSWPQSPPGVVWGPIWGQSESMCSL